MMGLTRVLPFSLHHACMHGFCEVVTTQPKRILSLTQCKYSIFKWAKHRLYLELVKKIIGISNSYVKETQVGNLIHIDLILQAPTRSFINTYLRLYQVMLALLTSATTSSG